MGKYQKSSSFSYIIPTSFSSKTGFSLARYKKKLSPSSSLARFRLSQKLLRWARGSMNANAIEQSIISSLIHESGDTKSAYFSSSLSNSGTFFVWWGSRNPKYPCSCFIKRWALLGVPPRILLKYGFFIRCSTHLRYSGWGSSRPILTMTRTMSFSRSASMSSRKMQLSLQTDTL